MIMARNGGLLQKYSQLGPCIATGDVNEDELEDFFVGGAAYQSGKIFIQKPDGTFISKNLIEGNRKKTSPQYYLMLMEIKTLTYLLQGAAQSLELTVSITGGVYITMMVKEILR
jgi:hypothetical protein